MLGLMVVAAMLRKNEGEKSLKSLRVDPQSIYIINTLCNKENKNRTWVNLSTGSTFKEGKEKGNVLN